MGTRKKNGAAATVHRIFVRIGALRRFHTLTQKTADLPVEVTWDRRREDRRDSPATAAGERREPEERRQGVPEERDRRKKPPFTWETADFVVVEAPPTQSKGRSKKR